MTKPLRNKLDDIEAMLVRGHRNVELPEESFVLWGLVCGFLILVTDHLISPQYFPDYQVRLAAQIAWLGGVLGGTLVLDCTRIRRRRLLAGETVSFAQGQLRKLWALILVLGLVATIGVNKLGVGHHIYAIWLLVTGAIVFSQGLFSVKLLEAAGLCFLAAGVLLLVMDFTAPQSRFLVAAALGLGLPGLGALVHLQSRQGQHE
ncbi:hypothetical protein [Pelagibacterium halotolerans]|uniref:hypothetical protein n=1 Tax=Pelagibacterium halotolerans TaxID=531813 RepID=UPI00384BFD26